MPVYELSVSHVLLLSNGITERPFREELEHRLNLTQSIHHNIRTRKLTHSLNLQQTVTYTMGISNQSISHSLAFQQQIVKNPTELSVTSNLILWQTIQRPLTGDVASFINLSQNVVGHGSKGTGSQLALTQTISLQVIRSRTVEHTLPLTSGVVGWLPNPDFNTLNPTITTNELVTFTYQGYSFSIRKPDFDDAYTDDLTRISRRTRGGDILISRDSIWPSVKNFTMRFTFLSQSDVDKLLSFMKLTLGKQCTYRNYDNVLWTGYITNPQAEAVQTGRSNFGLTLEFQGEVVE